MQRKVNFEIVDKRTRFLRIEPPSVSTNGHILLSTMGGSRHILKSKLKLLESTKFKTY